MSVEPVTPDVGKSEAGFPVSVTDEAIARVRKLIERDGRPGLFLRLGVKGGGCSGLEYVLRLDDQPRTNDLSTEVGGIRVAVDAKSAKFLAGSVLDFTGELIGGGFRFANPKAKRSCGCGTSFTPVD